MLYSIVFASLFFNGDLQPLVDTPGLLIYLSYGRAVRPFFHWSRELKPDTR